MIDARFDRVVNALQLDDKEDMIIIVVERSATTPALADAFRWQTMVEIECVSKEASFVSSEKKRPK